MSLKLLSSMRGGPTAGAGPMPKMMMGPATMNGAYPHDGPPMAMMANLMKVVIFQVRKIKDKGRKMGESLDGCVQYAKILIFVFNLVFFLIWAAFLGVGIWTITNFYKPDILAIIDNPAVTDGSYILIAVGWFIFILAGLGCCGAYCQNKCMMILYFIILLVVFIVQIAAFAVIHAVKEKYFIIVLVVFIVQIAAFAVVRTLKRKIMDLMLHLPVAALVKNAEVV